MPDANPTIVIDAPSLVRLELGAKPEPGPGQLLVETSTTLISTGTEIAIFDGLVDGVEYPFLPGYSNIGVVTETGPGVSGDWKGRRVASGAPHARYVAIDESAALPISVSSSDRELAFFALAAIALNGIRRSAASGGESAAVFGLGVLGQLVVRFCRLFGLRPVIGVDPSLERRAMLPIDAGVVGVEPDAAERELAERTHGRMADVVFDVTGVAEALPAQTRSVREQGRLVILGSPRGEAVPFDFYWGCHRRSLTIVGAHTLSHPPAETPGSPWTVARHVELFFDLVESGELDITSLITDVVPWQDSVAMFHELAQNRRSHMGVVLEWDSDGPG
jgi:2-desacetyl-2-hydroxyethyl bacteriochlorophyllide A dehydrogenase